MRKPEKNMSSSIWPAIARTMHNDYAAQKMTEGDA